MTRSAAAVALLLLASAAHGQTVATPTAVESSRVLCAAANLPCQLFGGQFNNTNASARWGFIFDAATAPTGGGAAITGCANAAAARPCWLKAYQLGANSTVGVANFYINQPLGLKAGLTVACSSTGPYTLTYAADCAFSFEVQQQ